MIFMKKLITEPIRKLAQIIIHQEQCSKLDGHDRAVLKNDGPKYLRHVQTNIKLKKKPLEDMTDTSKKVLMAYVIFLRQNISMVQGDKANEEDAAKILHGEVYKSDTKKKDELDEDLLKQLEKIGIQADKD